MAKAIGRVNLALQGGGAHGALTWGVLDRLLEEPSFKVEGISGASAGAMNAICVAHGLATGGNQQARETLDKFWQSVATPKAPLSDWFGYFRREGDLPGFSAAMMKMSHRFSPYQLNPFNVNPLKVMLTSIVDIELVASKRAPKLFIATTEAATGNLRIFRNRELTVDVFLASACLPNIQQAVEIDGVDYWDGGYSANPPITPLIFECKSDDILLVMLEPGGEQETPRSSDDIRTRTAALNFSTPLLTELRLISEMRRLAAAEKNPTDDLSNRLSNANIELLEDADFLGGFHKRSRINTQADFLYALKAQGREIAEAWLQVRVESEAVDALESVCS